MKEIKDIIVAAPDLRPTYKNPSKLRIIIVGAVGLVILLVVLLTLVITQHDSQGQEISFLETSPDIQSPEVDANAEMLIAIPEVPSQFLVPPPFPPPLSVLIRRKTFPNTQASRRYFQDPPRPFGYPRRIPVNSIQDILNQMERESMELDRIAEKKPKRINFYGRYRHRPNRPKVIPIQYNNEVPAAAPPMRDISPQSVAIDVNHLITQNQVPQREPPQLFYPGLSQTTTSQGNGLYDQIIATNKHRQETAKEAKPFSLMLDIYPMNDENKTRVQSTTTPPPLPPPQLPPLQIDTSYYNSINFPQIHPTIGPITYQRPVSDTISPHDEPEKMVVHLNLYPTKKKTEPHQGEHLTDFNAQAEDVFMPILNPQVYYRSKSFEDLDNRNAHQDRGNFVDIKGRLPSISTRSPTSSNRGQKTGVPRITMLKTHPIYFGQPVNVTDYRTTIAPHTINKFFYDEDDPVYTYLGQFNSNEIGRRIDIGRAENQEVKTTKKNEKSHPYARYVIPQKNSHQPDNPMIVENLSQYTESAISEEPSRKPNAS